MNLDKIFDNEMIKKKIGRTLSASEIFYLRPKESLISKLNFIMKNFIIDFLNFLPLKKRFSFSSRNISVVEKKYDKIAGTYLKNYINNDNQKYIAKLDSDQVVEILASYKDYIAETVANTYVETNSDSILEVGAGELTLLVEVLKRIREKNKQINQVAALDISLNRLLVGKKLIDDSKVKIDYLAKANAEKIPYKSNSFDFVFTSHCIEQVPHLFKNILDELMRVTKKYVVLVEPSYESGTDENKNYILSKGYIRFSDRLLKNTGHNLIFRKGFPVQKYINGSEIIIFKKITDMKNEPSFCVPGTDIELKIKDDYLISNDTNYKFEIKSGVGVFY